MNPPKVSVVVSHHHRRAWLLEALDSVAAQTFGDFELLVVNDAGPSASQLVSDWARGKAFKVRYLHREDNGGVAAARNTGVRAARGELIAYLDDDDLWDARHLEGLVALLESRPECGLAYGDAIIARVEWAPGPPRAWPVRESLALSVAFDRDALARDDFIVPGGMVHRRALYDEVGPFDETLFVSDDWDWLLRATRVTGFAHLPQVVVTVRIHSDGSNLSAQQGPRRRAALDAIERRHGTPHLEPKTFWEVAQTYARRALLAVAIACACAGTPPPVAATGLSASDRAVVRSVERSIERGLPAARALLVRSVEINSGTMNLKGVRSIGALFAPEFAALGFDTTWIDGSTWGRAGHLVARRAARGAAAANALRVLLIGHLDTVFESDSPFQRYEVLGDTAARGPGTIDMKGGDIIVLLALSALRDAGLLDRLNVEVFLSGDEENPGAPLALARRDLFAAADRADVALGFEDGDGDPRHATVARRGASNWTLRTSGRPAHSSQIFREDIGRGAIYELARILAAFHDSLSGETYLTVNPGVAVGGTTIGFDRQASRGTAFGKSNVIAESTLVAGDLRTLSPEQLERARAAMRRIVAASPPHVGAAIEFADGYPPLPPSEGNRRLLALYDAASRDLGLGPVTATDPARAGAADISFTAGRTPMALDALGLKGDGGHTVNETADLRTLPVQAKRAAVLLARLARRSAPGISR